MGLKFTDEPRLPGYRIEIFYTNTRVKREFKVLKRNVCLLIILMFFWAGAALASDNYMHFSLLTTKDLTFDASIAIEDAQYNLTNDLADRITILNISAERNLYLIKETNDLETLIILLKEYQNREMEILSILYDLNGFDAELVAEIVQEGIQKREAHLLAISENIVLNRTARPKFENAIINQEKVNIKHVETLAMAHESAQKRQEQTDQPGLSGSLPLQDSSFVPPGQGGTTPPGPPAGTPGPPDITPPGQGGTTPPGPPAGTPGPPDIT